MEIQSVRIAISQTAGSNAQEVIDNSKKIIDEAAKNFPKGVKYTILN